MFPLCLKERGEFLTDWFYKLVLPVFDLYEVADETVRSTAFNKVTLRR